MCRMVSLLELRDLVGNDVAALAEQVLWSSHVTRPMFVSDSSHDAWKDTKTTR